MTVYLLTGGSGRYKKLRETSAVSPAGLAVQYKPPWNKSELIGLPGLHTTRVFPDPRQYHFVPLLTTQVFPHVRMRRQPPLARP